MVKTGKERSTKFSEKHDSKVILYRIKREQEASKKRFIDPAKQHEIVDENLAAWIEETSLKFGERGTLYDFLKKILWNWPNIPDSDKAVLHAQWIEKGLTEILWLKIEAKYNEITTFHRTQNSHNIIVTFETDVFPYPQEDIDAPHLVPDDINFAKYLSRIGEDYIEPNEVLPVPNEYYSQHYWRQKTVKYGNVDYLTFWSDCGMDKAPTITVAIETVQPLLFEKSVSIFAHLTEPYQSPLDKSPVLETSFETESGEDKSRDESPSIGTSNANSQLSQSSGTPTINISYETEVS